MKKKIDVLVVGAGGIGSWLLPPLCTYLNYLPYEEIGVTVADGDSYEQRNHERQWFGRLGNKAEVLVEELTPRHPKIYFSARTKYITPQNVSLAIKEGNIVLSCVDNHATRLLLSDRCVQLRDVTFISGGNHYTDGNVQVHVRKDGRDLTRIVADPKYHPEIAFPKDKIPGAKVEVKEGCQEQAEIVPQLVVTNFSIASCMLNCFYSVVVEEKIQYGEVYNDVVMNKSLPYDLSMRKP